MTGSADALGHVWAKSPERTGEPGESLSLHTTHDLERLRDWRLRSPELPRIVGRPDLFDLAAWALVVHDLGKSARGFQAMLRGGASFDHRHEVLSLVAVGRLQVDAETLGLLSSAVATHHRDVGEILLRYRFGSADRAELLEELSDDDEGAWESWLEGRGGPGLGSLGFRELPPRARIPKARSLSDAMGALDAMRERLEAGSATDPFALVVRALRGLVMLADHAGSAHERVAVAPSLGSVRGFLDASRALLDRGLEAHQQQAAVTAGHAMLVAPTGSGKTEAALLWAAHQHELGSPGAPIFYVLPYRASLNAMRFRIPRYGVPESSVVLQHSTATSVLYSRLLEKGYDAKEAAVSARNERNLGRLMTAAVRVLTPYQLLRAFFGLPGHDAVLTDAAGGLFVLDELHAYDVPRLALILASMRHLASHLGARILALSATFPGVLQDALSEVLGESVTIHASPETARRFERHVLHLADRDLIGDESLAAMAARVHGGEAVLAVCSTVARAQQLYDLARTTMPPERITLLHSRFAGADRQAKESAIGARLGTRERRSESRQSGILLVATQVVEVSLDIDFDVLFTAPAPIEALLQRFGRVNRGLRGGLRDVIVHTDIPAQADRVYPRASVEAALQVLMPHDQQPIREADLQAWVDATYEPYAGRWRAELGRLMEEAAQAVVGRNLPLSTHPELAERFDELFDGTEVVPESLAAEYERRLRESPLDAVALRVPISMWQRARLRRAGLLERRRVGGDSFDVARVPYDAEMGLRL